MSDNDEEDEIEQEQDEESYGYNYNMYNNCKYNNHMYHNHRYNNHSYNLKGKTSLLYQTLPSSTIFMSEESLEGRVTILIDGEDTHNFIDSTLVTRWAIQSHEFEGFGIEVANGRIMPYIQKAP